MRARWYLVEFHRRLALPTSCLVLALVGIPLGLSSKKGGKSMGFVLTIVLVFFYYFISLTGISLGRGGQHRSLDWRVGGQCGLPYGGNVADATGGPHSAGVRLGLARCGRGCGTPATRP